MLELISVLIAWGAYNFYNKSNIKKVKILDMIVLFNVRVFGYFVRPTMSKYSKTHFATFL